MRVIIGNGKVSKILKKNTDIVLDHSQIEIKDIDSVYSVLNKFPKGSCVINTAAKINLEWCEENPLEAYMVNTVGAMNLMKTCALLGLKLVHISSGCIFDGNQFQVDEKSDPTPSARYTKTKVLADEQIAGHGYQDYLILRPRQLISAVSYPTNMLTKFMSFSEINAIDEPNSITCIEDFCLMIDHLLNIGATGTFNCANEGTTTPFEIAQKIQQKKKPDLVVNKISYEDYLKTLKVKRVNTVLDITKLKSTGFKPSNADSAIEWCLKNYA